MVARGGSLRRLLGRRGPADVAACAFAAGLLALGPGRASAQAGAAAGTLELFEGKVPAYFAAERGDLSISDERYKDGRRSLMWRFGAGGRLRVSRPFELRPLGSGATDQRRRGLSFWIYSPVAVPGAFAFDFYKEGRRVAGFEMKAGFVGWRAAVLSFEGDMDGRPVEGIDRLVVSAPAGVAGTVFLDQVGFDLLVDPRYPAPDYQLPGVNAGVLGKANRHWTAALQFDRWLRAAGGAAPADGRRDVAGSAVAARIEGDMLDVPVQPLPAIEREYGVLHNADGTLKALSQTSLQWDMYAGSGVARDRLDALRATTVTWRELGRFMRSVAVAFRRSRSEPERTRLGAIFAELVRHQIDQGLVRGSGQGLLHHQGYSLGEWADALFLMRDALGGDLAWAREAIGWFAGAGRIHEPRTDDAEFNADVMNTLAQPILYSILMDDDAAARARSLAAFGRWISEATLASPGIGGGIKPDGSVFHHSQHYVAYGNGALTGLTGLIYFLADTPYRIAPEAHARARKAVLMTRVLSNGGRILMSLSGRHVDGEQSIALAPFRFLALAGAPGEGGAADREVAAAYLRLLEGPGGERRGALGATPLDRSAAARFREAGILPEPAPVGSWTMNYSSLALHRRGGWLIGARGFSRYLVGNEAYSGKNLFGRYLNYGAMEILPHDPARRGFALEGWDWTRWPGTTAPHVPLDRLKARVAQVDAVAGVEEMLLSEESFSGGLDIRGRDGMFAMKLQAHPKYGEDLVARKSLFFFGDRVVALGSGIRSRGAGLRIETTVFQDRILGDGSGAWLAGVPSTADASERVVELDGWRPAADELDNAYCLAPGQRLRFRRGEQTSLDEAGLRATSGRFSSLVVDHGGSPEGGGYEYVVQVGSGRAAREFCARMSSGRPAHRVLSRSERAHVVRDEVTGLVGYAVFEEGLLSGDAHVRSVSRPSMLMLRSDGGRLEGSFVNPDLNLYQGSDPEQYGADGRRRERSVYALSWRMNPSKPIGTEVCFQGRWRSETSSGLVARYSERSGCTAVTFRTVDAAPVQFTLVRN